MMDCRIKISNLYGIDDANFRIDPGPTLITGVNSSGKTSIAKVMSALLAMDANPSHLSATQSKHYLRDGATDGVAEMLGIRWIPKSGIVAPPTTIRPAHPHAVGLINFTGNASALKDRAKLWEGLFIPSSPKKLLEPLWTLPKKQLDYVVAQIEENNDWDKAASIYEGQRRECKSRWGLITGRTYGVKIASTWLPATWSPRLDGASKEDLMAELVNAKDSLRFITTTEAVSASQIEEALRIRNEIIPLAEKDLADAQAKHTALQKLKSEFSGKTSDLSTKIENAKSWTVSAKAKLDAVPPHTCPSCSTGLQFKAGTLIEWLPPSKENKTELKKKYDATKKKLSNAETAMKGFESDLVDLNKQIHDSFNTSSEKRGKLRLLEKQAELADFEETEAPDLTVRTAAETKVMECQDDLDAFVKKSQAQKEHDNVVTLDNVCKLLGPDGARGEHMQECMGKIRAVLKRICEVTGWLPLNVDTDYTISSGGRPVQLTAKNEQLKAQWALQFACAYWSKDNFVILDEADTLKDESWEGLEKLVNSVCQKNKNLRVIVCATSTKVKNWNVIEL